MRRNHLFYFVVLIPLLLYISFMSTGLDDFDSFAFALDRWETSLLEVHPPGFPIYIFVSKFAQTIVTDTRLALTLVSATSGALGIFITAQISITHHFRRAGLIAAGLLIFLPGYWLNSELALSDIPGLVITLSAVLFLLKAQKQTHPLWFISGCWIAGISLGVRPHNVLPILLAGLWTLSTFRPFNSKKLKIVTFGILAGCIGIMMWLIPIYQTFDGYRGQSGFDAYIERLDNHRQHIQSSDSLFRQELTVSNLTNRIETYINGWSYILAGTRTPILLATVGLMFFGLIRLPLKQRLVWFLLIWFSLEALKIFLFASLERPRLYLPAVIPLVLLVGIGYSHWQNRLLRFGFIGIMGLSLYASLPLIQTLNSIPPPPEQATAYILENYPLEQGTATVVSQGSFQAAQYHLGAYKQLYTPYFDAESWANQITFDQPDYLIVLDGDDIAPEIFQALTDTLNYVTIDDRIFERDARVFPQHSTVRLQIMVKESDLQPQQLILPQDRTILTNNPSHGKYLGKGWYRIEDIGGTPGRWANKDIVLRMTLPPQDTVMSFVGSPYPAGQTAEIIVNGDTITTIDINQIWGTYQITIPAESIARQEITTIELHHSQAEYPENHNRQLAAAYSQFHFD